MSKNTNELKTGLPGRFGIDLSTLGSQLCSAKSLTQCRLRDLGLPCLVTSYLSPSARCASVNGLAGCYVSSIGKPVVSKNTNELKTLASPWLGRKHKH